MSVADLAYTKPMIPTRWYLPFFMPSTALMIGIALALLVAWLASPAGSQVRSPR